MCRHHWHGIRTVDAAGSHHTVGPSLPPGAAAPRSGNADHQGYAVVDAAVDEEDADMGYA